MTEAFMSPAKNPFYVKDMTLRAFFRTRVADASRR